MLFRASTIHIEAQVFLQTRKPETASNNCNNSINPVVIKYIHAYICTYITTIGKNYK